MRSKVNPKGSMAWRVTCCLAALLALAACSGPPIPYTQPSTPHTSAATPVTPTSTPPSTSVTSPPTTTTPTATSSPGPTLTTADWVTGLNVPWELAFAPDGRAFVTERGGAIRVVQGGQLQAAPWTTLDVAAVGEAGLLGMAVDPDFAINHYVYAAHTYRSGLSILNRLVRLREENGKGVLDKVLLDNVGGAGIHDGGRVKFGPDGKLYWTMGENGNANLAQDQSSLVGKILRINPDGTIPTDNPFPASPVYSYGHRNPQGLAWQPGTNRLYETEHGSSAQDEVNFIEPGKNYGWPTVRGDETREGMVSPIIQSTSSVTWAPSGATFVSGGPWDGSFLFVGLRGETLYRVLLDKNDSRKVVAFEKYLDGQFGRLRDIVQGPDGALYLLTNNRDGRGSPRPGDDRIVRITFR